ncbi:MAG: hypothetical protein HRT97_01915 [Moritella sp.]|uniref:DUF6988 family protein n=1 Tax=Moritella sp. TaxID=78556 RepID=UPI0025DE5DC2|nr:DUF5677 domain-containing protein [Moritella sp.]NQZ91079.1 hypothetical protein [Moritella sp.]
MEIEKYCQLIDFIEREVDGIKGEIEGIGNKKSLSFHNLALDHARSIVILINKNSQSSALALLRVLYESSIRGCWFKYCATQDQIESFIENDHLPKLKKLVKEVDEKMGFSGILDTIHNNDMSTLCSFTHSGVIQLSSNFNGKTYKNYYTTEQIEGALEFAVFYIRISFMEIISVASNRNVELVHSNFETHLTSALNGTKTVG